VGWKVWQYGSVQRLLLILVAVLWLSATLTLPVQALSIDDYFTYGYTVQLSQTEVQGTQAFSATVSGQAVCTKDLPLTPSSAYVTSRVIARHLDTGAVVTLNSGYTLTLDSFPAKQGDSAQETVVVPLAFPPGSQTGTYTVIGEILEAKVHVLVWLDVTAQLPPSQQIGAITYQQSAGGGGGAGNSGTCADDSAAPEETLAGTTRLAEFITGSGSLSQTATARSDDGRVVLTIPEGTVPLSEAGEPLHEITVTPVDQPPPAPAGAELVGLPYDLGPDGATFDQPVTVCLAYDPADIPEGASETSLVAGIYDDAAGTWSELADCLVDTYNHKVCGFTTHFTTFAVLAGTRPAVFDLSDLTIIPDRVSAGQTVTIRVNVTNSGDLRGTCRLVVWVDDATVAVQDLPLEGGATRTATFSASPKSPGTHSVRIGSLTGTFAVEGALPPATQTPFITSDLSIAPKEVHPGEDVILTVLVTNPKDTDAHYEVELLINDVLVATQEVSLGGDADRTVTFIASRTQPGVYAVRLGDEVGSFTVVDERAPVPDGTQAPVQGPTDRPIDWTIVGGAIAAVLVIAGGAILLFRRHRA